MAARAAGQSRRPAKGATRKATAAAVPGRRFAWLNRVLIGLGGLVVIVAAVQAYLVLQAIPVERVSVSGELAHTRAGELQAMVQPALAGGFLRADLQRIRQQLEALPWIFQATVQRKWPNTLQIHVVEQLPIARWGASGFLNHEGDVFDSADGAAWQSLPLLRGPEGTARSLMASYLRIVNILAPLQLAVAQLAVDERGQLEVVLASGMELALGSDDFLERMQRFVRIYRTELATRAAEVTRVDLRYAKGLAVTFGETARVAGI